MTKQTITKTKTLIKAYMPSPLLNHLKKKYYFINSEVKKAIDDVKVNLHDLKKFKKRNDITLVTQPLVMVSEIQRSGGTLLSQLFDGHPQLHAYPAEIMIGTPKWNWPDIDSTQNSRKIFSDFYSNQINLFIINGFYKKHDIKKNEVFFPFNFNRKYQKEIFTTLCIKYGVNNQRDALNFYFSSFFNALLDYDITGNKKYITGFIPRLNMYQDSIERFFRDYPDGKLITLVRDPVSWYASAKRHSSVYDDLDYSLELWKKSTEASIKLSKENPDQVKLIIFSELVGDTYIIMEEIANWLKIEFNEILLKPTFLCMPTKANSSFKVTDSGINKEVINRGSSIDNHLKEKIIAKLGHIYQDAMNIRNPKI